MADTDYAAELLAPKTSEATTDYASELLGPAKPVAPRKVTKTATAKSSPLIDTGAVADTVMDTPGHLKRALWGFWQGATDIPVGLVQLASKFGPEKIDEAVAQYVREREAGYQESRGDYADRADIGRVTGTVVASLPAGGKAAAATLPGRMVAGAKLGSLLGAATPVDPDAGDFGWRKGVQIAGGAATGALAVPVVEGLVKGVGAAVNVVSDLLKGVPARLTNKATQDAIENTLTVEMQKNGVNFADLSRQARDALILETQKALKAGGTLDEKAIARIADFQKLGIEPTRGQVSRDPLQFATERNIGKTEIGKPIADRLTEQNSQLITAVNDTRATTGGVAADSYEAGKSAMTALKVEDAAARKAVTAAYDAAKAKLGMEAEVPLQPIADRLGKVIDEVGTENIPGAVMRRLQEFGLLEGKRVKSFTIAEAEKLRKLIGNNMPGMKTPIDAALSPLKQSVDDAVNSLAGAGDVVGAEAAQAMGAAREVAKARFQKVESIPALTDMLKNKTIPPEDFVGTYVIRGSVDEVKSLMGQLPPGARRDVRAAVVDWLKSKAVSGADDTATFSQAGFNKALDSLGKRNLEAIFEDPQMIEQLRRIGRVAANVQKAPVSSGVNYSSSATAIVDLLDKVGRWPVVGALMGRPGDIIRASTVTRSLAPAAPVTQSRPLLTVEMLDEAARSGGVLAPAVGAGTALDLISR